MAKTTRPPLFPGPDGIVRLAGGNPQIAKGYGDAPVQAFIAAMPGWQAAVGARLDTLIVQTVPGVIKAVKWNTPMYGVTPDHYFIGFHCLTRAVKVAFYQGAHLLPLPPGASKQPDVRYLDIAETMVLDAEQFTDWVRQAGLLSGARL